ncbi:hypothetical protein V5O48_008376 [Marasmius crinis-equi]|uniref:Uncharacterized protein n=1 Tax=Marasmius crinis-equi TaxID=585013 RepID=A0ABR3FEK3_9AGAR
MGFLRNEAIFGSDAHVFRPERWLDDKFESKGTTKVGVYSNLVLELQAFLVELISNFEFSLTPECDKIRLENCGITVPTIEGEIEKGAQCPLRVRRARKDE